MKKTIGLLMAIVMSLGVAACGQTSSENGNTTNKLDFPKRPIEIVVPFGAGGSSDLMTRQVANIMGDYIDKPVNIVNVAGGGGIDGMVHAKNAPADGYTILQVTPSHAIGEATGRANANLTEDFIPLGNFQNDLQVMGVVKNSQFNTIDELIAFAKENPGALKIGGTSPGGLDNYMADAFAEAAGIELTYVPYNSAAETKAAALGGELDIYQDKLISFLSLVESGDVRPLVVLHDERLDMIEEFKDVPTTVEKGIDLVQGSWRGYAVKKGTPDDVVKFLAELIEKVYNSEKYQTAAETEMSNIVPGYISPEDYGKLWEVEVERFKAILGN